MKKIPLLLCLSLSLSACSQNMCHKKHSAHHHVQDTGAAVKYFAKELNFTINPYGVKTAIDTKADVVIVDVRKEADFKAGHIPGAVNLPYDQWDGFEGAQTAFPHLRKDTHNYVYCYQLLCNLGQKAAKKFAAEGYPVKEMKGGFRSWKEDKLPVSKRDHHHMGAKHEHGSVHKAGLHAHEHKDVSKEESKTLPVDHKDAAEKK